MKSLFILLNALVIVGCVSNPVNPSERALTKQAKAYENEYLLKAQGFRPSVIKSTKGKVERIIYFDSGGYFLGIEEYAEPPFDQYLSLLRDNPSINYYEATKSIQFKRQNYLAEDCPSIGTLLETLSNRDLTPYPSTDIDLDMPTYQYVYEIPKSPSYNVLYVTSIQDHPVIDIYKDALKEMENCPHPKDPPKFD